MSKVNDFKRVAFTTVGQTLTPSLPAGITSDAASFRFGAEFLAASQNKQSGSGGTGSVVGGSSNGDKKTAQRTIRVELELFKTDSSAYPEFNYKKLINMELKKLKKTKEKTTNGFGGDPFEDNDDDVQRIAKEMEKKYANTYGGKTRGKKDDFCDIGMGYDESDSFIDNTEAYDEVVPAEVETIEGGFYINCGALEFKSLRPEKPPKTRTDDIIKMPERIRKRILSSTSGSDDSDSSDESDANDNDEENSEDSDEDDDDDEETSDESSIKTSKSKDSYLSNEKNGKHSNLSNDKENKSIVLTTSSSSTSPKPIPSDNNSENEAKSSRFNPIKTTTVKDMLKAKRDKFLKARVVRDPSGAVNGQEKSSDNQSSSDDSSDSDEGSDNDNGTQDKSNDKNKHSSTAVTSTTPATSTTAISKDKDSEKLRSSDTKLPKLDEDITLNIFQFKELVKAQNCIGKKFQFNDSLTEIFLKIDESLLCIDKPQRNMVFAHLEFQLMLPKYYFLRKAKQLRIKEEKSKVNRALMKLSAAVSETMSTAIPNYELDLRKFNEIQNGQQTNTEQQPMKMPRKKFPWNWNIRNLLFEVYQVRWTSYPVLGTRKETLEEFINGFLRSKVVELWPTGWMRYEEIQREIEKRKNAQKKAKERERLKKESSSNATNTPAANTNIITTAIISDSDSNLATNSVGIEQRQQQEKQIAAGGGGTLKRKNSDASAQKAAKTKAQRLSGAASNKQNKHQKQQQQTTPTTTILQQQQQQQMPQQTLQAPIDVVLDLCTPSKRAENNLMLATTANAMGNVPASAMQTSPFPSALNNSPSVKPALATHVIDLENYTSRSDILKLAASRISATTTTTAPRSTTKPDTSDEDSCVEFVGIYPAQTKTITAAAAASTTSSPNSYKQKTKNNKQANSGSSSNNTQRAPPNIVNSPLSSLQMEPPNFYSVKANANNNCEYGVAQVMKQMEEIKRSIQQQQLSKNAAAAAAAAAAQLSQLNAKNTNQ